MNAFDCEKINHHKPPYEYTRKFSSTCTQDRNPCGTCKQDANLRPCPTVRLPEKRECVQNCVRECAQPDGHGLLQYRSWWERIEVCLSVNGEQINGVPIFVKDDTLRVISNDYSYFIPLSRVDYIRTDDGLRTCTG